MIDLKNIIQIFDPQQYLKEDKEKGYVLDNRLPLSIILLNLPIMLCSMSQQWNPIN